uniref:Ycf80 n=1 Tax=Osmundaria fimbriata TaxID=228265 RepID=A0A1Z1M410_OSMFI|nr:hypothetical protein [Osmundaria fimbriata]ARW60789.1 hypothetical protein [Osmundaria fimbriata]
MILSNLILFPAMRQEYFKNDNTLSVNLTNHPFVDRSIISLKYEKSPSILISDSRSLKEHLASVKQNNLLIKRNFWQKLINHYWQETIFISKTESSFDNYFSKLKSSGLSIYQGNDYKSFLLKFGKDLLNGKISVSMHDLNDKQSLLLTNSNNNHVYLKYTWFKLFDFTLLNFKSYFMRLSSNTNFIYKNITNNILPIFFLINNKGQIILSESSEQLSRHNIVSSLNHIIMQYIRSDKVIYTGLLFVNPEDALEYQEYIRHNQLTNSTRIEQLKFVASNINLYYKLLDSSSKSIEFRLVPDLKEISDLICKYRRYRNVSFDIHQKYGRNYFQGQPIYVIKPIITKNKISNKVVELNYNYWFIRNKVSVNYRPIFLNYNTMLTAWRKFRQEHNDYKLPVQPKVYISNLETFLQTPDYQQNKESIIFLPSMETYKFIRKNSLFNAKEFTNLRQFAVNKGFYIKTLFFRIFWSLTSRQPINW